MENVASNLVARRAFLAGTAAVGIMALPGCQSMGGFSMVEAIRRLLDMSAKAAFAKLTAPGGFWDSEVARFDLPDMFGASGPLKALLLSSAFRSGLQKQLNVVAEKGAERAAPLVYDAVTKISIPDALAIVRGGSSAATAYLRGQMGQGLVGAMVPGLSDALRVTSDPVLGKAIKALSGVDVGQMAQSIATKADNSIWNQIGLEEGAIRANPERTNDPLLIGVFKVL